MLIFRTLVGGISSGCVLGGEVWWAVGEVEAIGASRNFVSACLPPCSSRMSEALYMRCGRELDGA